MNKKEFIDGNYYFRFSERLVEPHLKMFHQRGLWKNYGIAVDLIIEQSKELAEKTGKNPEGVTPFQKKEPTVMLCGAAGEATASTFVKFVQKQNPRTKIAIMDISPFAVGDCQNHGLDENPNVSLVVGDATEAAFEKETFDLIETDALLQFFPQEEKRKIISEWQRILKPGGIVTTRDWILSDSLDNYHLHEERNRETMQGVYGVQAYPITKSEFTSLMGASGFVISMRPATGDNTPLSAYGERFPYLYHIVARKMEDEKMKPAQQNLIFSSELSST